jgi:uncharacterized protein
MLGLNLAKIRTAQEHFEHVYQPQALGDEAEAYGVAAPVGLSFDVFKDKDQFRLVGRLRTRLELPCSRCLEPFGWPVDAAFDLRYLPQARNAGEGEREIAEDDLTTAFYSDDTIDLGQLMREQFYLSLPMKPLCREECLGLCPSCGANRNHTRCDCSPQWEDPRLAALKAFKTSTPPTTPKTPKA